MIEILDSGYHITVQDRGRSGFSKFGVPVSGSIDYLSSNNANSIVGNTINEPVFEIAMTTSKLIQKINHISLKFTQKKLTQNL